MSFDYEELKNITQLSTSAVSVYANPADKKSFVRLIILHNSSASEVNVVIHKVPSGGSASAANQFYEELLPAKATRELEFAAPGIILKNSGDAIYAVAGANTAVNLYMSGGVE